MTVATPTIQLTTDSGDTTDLITNSALLKVSDADAGVTRTYQINDDQATSKYEVPPEDGEYTVLLTDTDSLGNSASASISFTLDTVDPTTPEVSLESDTGDSLTDRVTRYAYLTENASEVGATRSYSLNGVASDSYVMPSLDAAYVLVVTDTDAAGNAVSATLEFTLDTTLLAPTAVLSLDSGDDADGITKMAGVTFSQLASGDTRSYTINDGDASDEFLTPTVEGTYKVVVIDTDAAGNTDTATLVFEFDKTLNAPTAALADDSGDSKQDLITNSAALSLNDQDEDATRSYQVDNLTASDIYVAPTDQGSHTVLVTDTDTAGNTAKVSVSFTLDTSLTTPTVAFGSGSDTGSSAQDAISNSAALTFNSKDEDATRVYTLSKAGVVVASGAEYAAPSADGVYDLSVTDTDTAGNTQSASQRFTLDTTAPTAPLISSVDSGSKGDGLTNSAALTFNDKDADATRSYSLSVNGADPVVGAQYSTPTVDGDYVLVLQDTDTAGNTSRAEIAFTLDRTLAQPTVSLASDTGTAGDSISNTAELNFSEAALDVTRTFAVNAVSGAASYTAPTIDGTYDVVVTDTDAAGNVKTASLSFALDSFIKAPTVALANGYTGVGTTDSAAMVFSDKDAGATRIYTITVGAVSTPYTEYVAPVYNGSYEVTVTDTDLAGNEKSALVDFTLYTVLAIPTVELTNNSGDKSDTISNAAALTFSTAAPDVTRTYTLNGAASATYVAPTADGVYTMVVTDVDSAQDTESVSYSFTLDRTLAAPTLSLLTNSGDASDAVTKVAGLALSAAAADVTRTYTVNGVAVDAIDTTADGSYAIVVKDTDQAGNEKSASLSFTLDTTLTAPTLELRYGITDGIANSAAMTFNAPDSDATRVYTITTNGVGVSSASYVAPKKDGIYLVAVTDTDTAGNVASASLDFTLEIIGKTVDFQAYHWKSHALLGDVVVSNASDASQTITTENGLGQFTAVTESTLLVTAERSIPALEADITSAAVNLQDAIAILKMVVGLDVNGSSKALSPYQALAADFNGDGVVSLTDAIGVLKHVVGLTQTSTPHWAFANEADLTVPAKANTTPGDAPAISSDLSEVVEVDVHFGLVGYLVGDVDGSFAGLSTATNLLTSDSAYFTELVASTDGLSLAQFGVYSST